MSCASHNNSCPQVTMSNATDQKLGYAVAYGGIVVLGLPLNAVSLWILLRRHSVKTPSAVLMINLALSDLLLVVSLPMRIYFYATGTWPFSKEVCSFITMFFRNNLRSSTAFITIISVDRLLAVVYPLRSRHLRTSCNAWKTVAVTWIILLVVNIPESLEHLNLLKNNTYITCFNVPSGSYRPGLSAIAQSTVIFILLAVNILCTALVSWTLHRRVLDSVRANNKVNVMLIFVMNLVMFTICFVPLSIGLLTSMDKNPIIFLASINCCLDPLLYYFSLDAFWKKKEDVDLAKELQTTN